MSISWYWTVELSGREGLWTDSEVCTTSYLLSSSWTAGLASGRGFTPSGEITGLFASSSSTIPFLPLYYRNRQVARVDTVVT